MAMALISLTWEIDQGPDCAQKQVVNAYQCFHSHKKQVHQPATKKNYIFNVIEMNMVISDRCTTISEMGNNARSCYDSSE